MEVKMRFVWKGTSFRESWDKNLDIHVRGGNMYLLLLTRNFYQICARHGSSKDVLL